MSGALAGVDVLILAGGKGTRLASVLPDRQKVTAEIAGKPFLGYLIEHFRTAGARRFVLAAGHRADDVRASLEALGLPDVEFVVSVEPEPLGTGGAVAHAKPHLTASRTLIANGDSFAPVSMAGLVAAHEAAKAALTLSVVEVADPARYGRVEFDGTQAVTAFVEKGTSAPVGSAWINAGIYLADRATLDRLAQGASSLERDLLPGLIGKGLVAYPASVPFLDIGTPETLVQAAGFVESLKA